MQSLDAAAACTAVTCVHRHPCTRSCTVVPPSSNAGQLAHQTTAQGARPGAKVGWLGGKQRLCRELLPTGRRHVAIAAAAKRGTAFVGEIEREREADSLSYLIRKLAEQSPFRTLAPFH